MTLSNSALGKKSTYKDSYDPTLLFKIPRIDNRKELGLISDKLPFHGVDVWNAYELSWLDKKGKPHVAIFTFFVPSASSHIVESKSVKLYFNSFNNFIVDSVEELERIILQDLSNATHSEVKGQIFPLNTNIELGEPDGINIDDLDVECDKFDLPDHSLIKCENAIVEEELNSNLLKSNCLVTGQPDWGTIVIKYKGKKLKHDALLKYLVSFRNCNEFAEQCCERIFVDIKNAINPDFLSIYIVYTRRGGIDICPYRTTDLNYTLPTNKRLIRQ